MPNCIEKTTNIKGTKFRFSIPNYRPHRPKIRVILIVFLKFHQFDMPELDSCLDTAKARISTDRNSDDLPRIQIFEAAFDQHIQSTRTINLNILRSGQSQGTPLKMTRQCKKVSYQEALQSL